MQRRQDHDGEYEVLEEIGRGSFGSVRKVVHLPTKTLMVRKEIKYGHMNQKERQQLIAECRILSQLNHENIVKFHSWDFDEQGQVLYLYMEYCSKGDLQKLIVHYKEEHKYMPEQTIWAILAQLLMALYRCHYGEDPAQLVTIYDRMRPPSSHPRNVVIHRDLKPGNVFLTSSGSSGSVGTIKLGDFGLAKALGNSTQFATTYVGTPYYMSPEVLMDQPYSPLSDVWSLGCIVYEMCTLRPPFQAKNYVELQNKIKMGKVDSELPDYYSAGLASIVKSMIRTDLTERASTFELLQDIQVRTSRKALQLEKFERNLLDYEQELRNIEKILEKQALELDQQTTNRKGVPPPSQTYRWHTHYK
ncbi:similar to Saccharomyces cerevisiae YAR018C KIN3 Nonessential serine/threonine protein kinase [Maudiozyma barnettii]|uniref:non-specific serine/threonine protein kinase n=1 Tax=Maudiozyma barnettii TaxID=61262 RepID=A0A8H2VKP7_9SACH|nr:serine/threonine protein kinase KIN3 [Kazachstania barnettii]CAB4257187.1 similar to Saccharomyces cerevisiae YAR018C KIN3 Nonessential serine/threonine protein kinase [Kazachstania barnettii]CAD1779557.1 similar to Saccharomyces cerevisiae YAR018C KIN3 Nonessential serine/threonine protein kinase [Kazachstania barnettii]